VLPKRKRLARKTLGLTQCLAAEERKEKEQGGATASTENEVKTVKKMSRVTVAENCHRKVRARKPIWGETVRRREGIPR